MRSSIWPCFCSVISFSKISSSDAKCGGIWPLSRDFHSALLAFIYPILHRNGGVLATSLVPDIEPAVCGRGASNQIASQPIWQRGPGGCVLAGLPTNAALLRRSCPGHPRSRELCPAPVPRPGRHHLSTVARLS